MGYVCCVLFGCMSGSCFEYTGAIPSGYSSYEDWADNAKVQAYYLNAYGNLTYDAAKAATIPDEDEEVKEEEEEENVPTLSEIVDAIYPVGSIYMSVNAANPSTLFGGSWARIEDTFLLAGGSYHPPGETGGASKYELSAKHKHLAPIGYNSTALGALAINGYTSAGRGNAYSTVDVKYSGSSLASNVNVCYTADAEVSATIPTVPPYLSVYVWERIA